MVIAAARNVFLPFKLECNKRNVYQNGPDMYFLQSMYVHGIKITFMAQLPQTYRRYTVTPKRITNKYKTTQINHCKRQRRIQLPIATSWSKGYSQILAWTAFPKVSAISSSWPRWARQTSWCTSGSGCSAPKRRRCPARSILFRPETAAFRDRKRSV